MTDGSGNDAGFGTGAGRPAAVARAAREFTQLLGTFPAEALTSGECAALQALLEDLMRLRAATRGPLSHGLSSRRACPRAGAAPPRGQ